MTNGDICHPIVKEVVEVKTLKVIPLPGPCHVVCLVFPDKNWKYIDEGDRVERMKKLEDAIGPELKAEIMKKVDTVGKNVAKTKKTTVDLTKKFIKK